MTNQEIDRLYVLDKCTDGKMTQFHELTGVLFEDMQYLYNTAYPLLQVTPIDAITYVRHEPKETTFIMHTLSPINKESVLLPTNIAVEIEDRTIQFHIPIKIHAGGETG